MNSNKNIASFLLLFINSWVFTSSQKQLCISITSRMVQIYTTRFAYVLRIETDEPICRQCGGYSFRRYMNTHIYDIPYPAIKTCKPFHIWKEERLTTLASVDNTEAVRMYIYHRTAHYTKYSNTHTATHAFI